MILWGEKHEKRNLTGNPDTPPKPSIKIPGLNNLYFIFHLPVLNEEG